MVGALRIPRATTNAQPGRPVADAPVAKARAAKAVAALGIPCPGCGTVDDSKVIDSRPAGTGTRRRRECLSCLRRFSTTETLVVEDDRSPRVKVMAALPATASEVANVLGPEWTKAKAQMYLGLLKALGEVHESGKGPRGAIVFAAGPGPDYPVPGGSK